MIRLRENEFLDIVAYVRQNYGINLDKKKILIECRLSKELENQGITSYSRYLEMIKKDKDGELAGEMINRLTTNYTYFMREEDHFSILEEKIMPEICERKRYGAFNIWCAGCATGEECYTLAMTLADYNKRSGYDYSARILATDVSGEVLCQAEEGVYSMREWDSLPGRWQEEYCYIADHKHFGVDRRLRDNITFMRHNLMEELPDDRKFDLIFCRNVMIYFDRDSRRRLIGMLEKRLRPGGYLLIGHAELLSTEETRLKPVYPAIYKNMEKA